MKDTAFTEGDEAYLIPVYYPHQMLIVYDFTILNREGQEFWMLRRAYQFVRFRNGSSSGHMHPGTLSGMG